MLAVCQLVKRGGLQAEHRLQQRQTLVALQMLSDCLVLTLCCAVADTGGAEAPVSTLQATLCAAANRSRAVLAAESGQVDDEELFTEDAHGQNADSGDSRVVVTLQTKLGDKLQCRLTADAPFLPLFDHFERGHQDKLLGAIPTFWLDGDKLRGNATPAEMDVEDGTVIDVQW